ncbi:hypothetical protein Tco_0510627 [Tanacetum coccineum]
MEITVVTLVEEQMSPWKGTSLDPSWSELELHLSLSKVEGCRGLGGSRLTTSDKEVTKQDLMLKGGDRGACKLLGDVKCILLGRSLDSLQALSNFGHYLFSGFMDYFWSRKLNISNFGPANRSEDDDSALHAGTISFMYNIVRVSILSVSRVGMKCADLVRRSTMTQIVSCPLEVLGSFVMKFFVILSHFHIGISGCTSKLDGF